VKVLALELSTAKGSIALLDGSRVAAETVWHEPAARHSRLFVALQELLRDTSTDIASLELLAVGRGPGSFSGMRLAMTVAQALALPRGKPVYAVSSGEALALRHVAGKEPCRVAVAGDARRGAVWCGVFEWDRQALSVLLPWTLCAPRELSRRLPPDCIGLTPHWDQLSALGAIEDRVRWVRGPEYPDADHVARLAALRLDRRVPSEPLEPLYLHPPL
jgi:tRNA threonylcarbamoyladenosine biosynthesis protein TsaB